MPNTPVPAAGGAMPAAEPGVVTMTIPTVCMTHTPRRLMAVDEQLRAAIAVRDRVVAAYAAGGARG